MPIYQKGRSRNGLKRYVVYVCYTNAVGEYKQTSRVVYGKDQANEMERQLELDVKEYDKIKARMTLQELFDKYMDSRQTIRASTLDKNRREWRLYIAPTMANVRIEKLTAQVLEKWKMSVDKMDLSLQTKQHAYNLFRQILNWGVKMEFIGKNNLLKVGTFRDSMYIKKEMDFYTDKEFLKFIEVARQQAEEQEHKMNMDEWEYFVFFNIAFFTGLRKGEINGLQWGDIEGEYLKVKRSISQKLDIKDFESPPKSDNSIRILRMPQPLIDILTKHRERKDQLQICGESDKICGNGRSLRDTTVDVKNRKYAELAGLKRIRIHDFRHSHVSFLIHYGVSIHAISKRLGHAKVEITMNTYGHLYKDAEDKVIEVLNQIAS